MGNIAGKRRENYSWHTVSVDYVLSTKFAKEYTHLKENIMWIKKKQETLDSHCSPASREEDFQLNIVNVLGFFSISLYVLLAKVVVLHWNNLESPSNHVYAKFHWNCSSASRVFFLSHYYLQLTKGVALHSHKWKFPLHKYVTAGVAQWVRAFAPRAEG